MVEVFAAKAQENIESAEILFNHQKYNACVNRAYYAAFHAAIAALAHFGFVREKISHEGLQSKFHYELIHRRKIFPRHIGGNLLIIQSVRNNADYKLIHVSKKVASRQLKRAKEIVETILKEIQSDQ